MATLFGAAEAIKNIIKSRGNWWHGLLLNQKTRCHPANVYYAKYQNYCVAVRNFPFFHSYQDQIKIKNNSLSSLFFRKRNTDDNTPLNFFDEIEIHPLIIDVEDDVCPDMFPTIYQCLQRVGLPRNYGKICLWHRQICRLSSGWVDGFSSLSRKSMYIRVTFLTESLPSFRKILTLDRLISSAFICTSRLLIPFTQITANCNLWNLENKICIFYIYKLMYVNSFFTSVVKFLS